MDLCVLLVWFQFKMRKDVFPSKAPFRVFKDMDTINSTHDIFYYFPFPHCVILSYLQHISSLNLQIWKSNYKRMNSNKAGCAERDIFRHARGYRSGNFCNPFSGDSSKENYQSCLC